MGETQEAIRCLDRFLAGRLSIIIIRRVTHGCEGQVKGQTQTYVPKNGDDEIQSCAEEVCKTSAHNAY